jgi:hypothetical protein
MADPAICSDCISYDPIDDSTGKCKHSCPKRCVAPKGDHDIEIINGWPIVKGDEMCCADAE